MLFTIRANGTAATGTALPWASGALASPLKRMPAWPEFGHHVVDQRQARDEPFVVRASAGCERRPGAVAGGRVAHARIDQNARLLRGENLVLLDLHVPLLAMHVLIAGAGEAAIQRSRAGGSG